MSIGDFSPDFPVPFFRSKEENFVFLYRATDAAPEIVSANRIFLGGGIQEIQNRIFSIQNIVPAEVVGAAVKVVSPRLAHKADYASARSAKLSVVAIALDLELLDGIKRGINEDGAIGS